jgi:hypothetical protein
LVAERGRCLESVSPAGPSADGLHILEPPTELKASTPESSPRGDRWRALFRKSPGGGPSFFDLYPNLKPQHHSPTSPSPSPTSTPAPVPPPPSQPSLSGSGPIPAKLKSSGSTGYDDDTVAQTVGVAETAEWQRLVDWLTGLQMEHYVSVFHEQVVRFPGAIIRSAPHPAVVIAQGLTRLSSLELLNEEDLAEIGIQERDRVPLLKAIQAFSLRTREWTNTALAHGYFVPP